MNTIAKILIHFLGGLTKTECNERLDSEYDIAFLAGYKSAAANIRRHAEGLFGIEPNEYIRNMYNYVKEQENTDIDAE